MESDDALIATLRDDRAAQRRLTGAFGADRLSTACNRILRAPELTVGFARVYCFAGDWRFHGPRVC